MLIAAGLGQHNKLEGWLRLLFIIISEPKKSLKIKMHSFHIDVVVMIIRSRAQTVKNSEFILCKFRTVEHRILEKDYQRSILCYPMEALEIHL